MKDHSKKLVLILSVVAVMMLVGCSQGSKPNNDLALDKESLLTQLNLGKNGVVIESKSIDVTGDGNKDNVVLVGSKADEGKSPFRENLMIIVQEDESEEYLKATYDKFSGYEPKLTVKDFTGDKIADVMITANSGGSGGIYNHLIATFKDAQAKVIFDQNNNKGLQVSGQFMPDFKAKVNFEDLNKEALIDISVNKANYIQLKIYNQEGALVQKKLIRPSSYPFSNLKPIDYNRDGKYELRGLQKIVGANNADTISEIESIWSYDNNKWNLKEVKYNTILLKHNSNPISDHRITGYIKEIKETEKTKYVLVVDNLDDAKPNEGVMLLVSKDTKLLKEEGNKKIQFKDLKEGMKIEALRSNIMTMSLPPQTNALKIIVKTDTK